MIRRPRTALNPILLKELRQSVRSRFVSGAYCLFLLLMAIVTGVMLLNRTAHPHFCADALFGAGRDLFHALFVPLTLVCILFVPIYAGVRMAIERGDEHLDLQFITRLSAAAILRGKFLSALALIVLMTSAALPFLTLTFRLGGIDLPTTLLVLMLMLLVAALAVLFALLLGSLPGSRLWRVLLGLLGLSLLFTATTGTHTAAAAMIRSGIGSAVGSAAFWQGAGMTAGGGLILGGLMFALCTARISPPAANRALPIRIWGVLAWLGWGLAMTGLAFSKSSDDYLFGWLIPTVLFCIAAFAASVCEPPGFGRRVRRSIPRRPLLRAIVYPFFSGAQPATTWTLLLAAATLAAWAVLEPGANPHPSPSSSSAAVLPVAAGFMAYAFAYSQTAFWLWSWRVRKWLTRGRIWVVFLVLASLGAVLPALVGLGRNLQGSPRLSAWSVGNPFALFEKTTRDNALAFALAWSAVMAAPFLIRLIRSCKQFKPLEPAARTDETPSK